MAKVKKTFNYLEDGSVDIIGWAEKVKLKHHLPQNELLKKICLFTKKHTQGLTTFYGQPCIEQGLTIADILLDLKLDEEAVAAGILTATLSLNTLSDDIIKKEMGDRITKLLTGFKQMESISNLQKQQQSKNNLQIEKIRKMLLSMAADIRVVIIKLAERVALMYGIQAIPEQERKPFAQEILDIYAPLANRLGIGQIKWQLEDLAFRYLNSDTYKTIAKFLDERRDDREEHIEKLVALLKEKMLAANIKARVYGRAKHIYSIYAKAQKKNINYKNIYDYSAVRIIVHSIEECYAVLSIVHSLWSPIIKEFDDYIANPKENGYRSIHTAVIDENNKQFEIQIRTEAMHEEAEHGVAAHWVYKESKAKSEDETSKISYLRQLLDWHKDISNQPNTINTAQQLSLDNNIYVVTPKGDIIDLGTDASPIDFAYHLHSELGHQVRGAKVNGHIVPLNHALKTGDKIEILINPHGTPSRDWLNPENGYVRSSRARSKIMRWFRQQNTLASSTRANTKTSSATPLTPKAVEKPILPMAPVIEKNTDISRGIAIQGAADFLTRFAKCCKPIPGDDIIGYITQGRGITIHKKNCNNALHISDTRRLMQINWDHQSSGMFSTDLKITAQENDKLLNDLTALLANEKIRLLNFNSTFNKHQNRMFILITIKIQDQEQLKRLLQRIGQLPQVMEVIRVS